MFFCSTSCFRDETLLTQKPCENTSLLLPNNSFSYSIPNSLLLFILHFPPLYSWSLIIYSNPILCCPIISYRFSIPNIPSPRFLHIFIFWSNLATFVSFYLFFSYRPPTLLLIFVLEINQTNWSNTSLKTFETGQLFLKVWQSWFDDESISSNRLPIVYFPLKL